MANIKYNWDKMEATPCIVADYIEGMNFLQLQEKYNIPAMCIHRYFKMNDISIRARGPNNQSNKLSKTQIKQLLQNYTSGIGSFRLAKKYNVGMSTIQYHVKKAGIMRVRTTKQK